MNPMQIFAALRRTRPWLAAGLALLPLAVGQAEPAALDLSTLPRRTCPRRMRRPRRLRCRTSP